MAKLILIIAALCASVSASAFAAGLPTRQDVEDQLKRLYPNERGADLLPKGNQFEVLFLSPLPTSCLVDATNHRVSHCRYAQ